MTEREALKLALDFVASISPAFICEATHHKKNERHEGNEPCPHVAKQKATYEAIKEALAQPEQEPVAWRSKEMYSPDVGSWFEYYDEFRQCSYLNDLTPLYTTPPHRTWVGLTDDEIKIIWCDIDGSNRVLMRFARAIEAAHGIKGET